MGSMSGPKKLVTGGLCVLEENEMITEKLHLNGLLHLGCKECTE
jgi:hypothetical protein